MSEVDTVELGRIAAGIPPDAVVMIERVHAMPGQGVTSMFTFGRALGAVEQALGSLRAPLYCRPPQWQAALGVRGKQAGEGDETVVVSISLARQLFPNYQHYFTRKKDHGRADAALIAYYASTQTTHIPKDDASTDVLAAAGSPPRRNAQ